MDLNRAALPAGPPGSPKRLAPVGTFNSATGDPDALFPEVAIACIAEAIRELREVRRTEFGLAIAEPAWDMIIELYYRESIAVSTTAADLKQVSNVPGSTADRWLKHLKEDGWIVMIPPQVAADADFVGLTEKTRSAMERYLVEVRSVALRQPRR